MITGVVSIAGWASGFEPFYDFLKVFGIVQIDTAVSFLFAGLALFLFNREPPSAKLSNTAFFSSLLFLSVSILSLSGYLKINGLLLWQGYQGTAKTSAEQLRMAPTTIMYFLFLGAVFTCLRSKKLYFSSQLLALIGIFIGLLNLMGHLYAIPALLSIGDYPQTDLLSTMLFILLVFGGLFSSPGEHFMAVISSPLIGGIISRKLLPLAVSIPVLLGWLRLTGEKAGMYGPSAGVAITGLSSIIIFTAVIWGLSRFLNRIDEKREEAETFSRQTNDKLANLVETLEEEGEKTKLIAEMKDLLQTCSSIHETSPVIKKFIGQILPECDGALFLYSPSRNDLEAVVYWGKLGENSEEILFKPEDCWALRRGRPYEALNPAEELVCPHVKIIPTPLYFCFPLTAYGEVFGLLHLRDKHLLRSGTEGKSFRDPAVKKTVASIAEHLALSLANLKLKETLKNQSIRDPLTGLFNRRYMEESLQREIFRASRKKSYIGIIMIDIDHFKKFNDSFGHSAGDELLIQLGKFLQNKIRASDVACRYGGEEFTLFLPESSPEGLFKRAEDLRVGATKLQISSQGKLIDNITVSMGISVYPKHGTDAETLLKVADNALYRAKKEGRNRVVVED